MTGHTKEWPTFTEKYPIKTRSLDHSGAADMLTWTQGPNFAEDIKKEVATLLTIGDLPGATLEKTKRNPYFRESS